MYMCMYMDKYMYMYMYMYKYKYISLLDTDEVIVPGRHQSWAEMLEAGEAKGPADTWIFRNAYFLDGMPHLGDPRRLEGVPAWHHILRHVTRARAFTAPGRNVKLFFSTERVLLLHHHHAVACLAGRCRDREVDTAVGRLQHYRATCARYLAWQVAAR